MNKDIKFKPAEFEAKYQQHHVKLEACIEIIVMKSALGEIPGANSGCIGMLTRNILGWDKDPKAAPTNINIENFNNVQGLSQLELKEQISAKMKIPGILESLGIKELEPENDDTTRIK